MADVILLLLAAVLVAVTALVIVRAELARRRRRQLRDRQRPARLSKELGEINDYIRRLGQASTDDDLRSLEEERENSKWDGLSSR